MDLAHLRHVERGYLRTLADLGLARRFRLDVDDDVRLGERPSNRILDGVCGGVPLRDSRVGRDADDDVDEVPPGRLAEPQAVKPNPRHVHANRPARRLGCVRRSAIHEDVDVAADEPAGRGHHEDGDEQRSDGVTLRPTERGRRQPAEDGERPGEVAAEVERVREQRCARVAPGRPQRDHRARQIDRDDGEHDGERPPRRIHLRLDLTGEPQHREQRHAERHDHEHRRLGERREMLRLPVPVRMAGIRRTAGDADGEERQQRRDEVRPRVHGLRHETEAAAREAGGQLEPDERAGGADGDERRPALRSHGGRLNPLYPPRELARAAGTRTRRGSVLLAVRDAARFGQRPAAGASARSITVPVLPTSSASRRRAERSTPRTFTPCSSPTTHACGASWSVSAGRSRSSSATR